MMSVRAKRSKKWRLKARRKQSKLLPSDLHAENAEAAAAAAEEFDVDRLAGAVGSDDAQAVAPVRTKVRIVLLVCIGGILLGSAASRYALSHRAESGEAHDNVYVKRGAVFRWCELLR
jgi:hypothetical protein